MSIHSGHPFATPGEDRDLARRLRARLGGRVTLWTAGAAGERTGLTVSSMMLAAGEPAQVLGLVDPDSDLGELLDQPNARFVVSFLDWEHRDLAEQFAGLMPAPGGAFAAAAWEQTGGGPRLAGVTTWAACTVLDARPVGWSLLVTARLDEAEVGADREPLGHRHGRYVRLPVPEIT